MLRLARNHAPTEFYPWATLYNRWKRWSDKGIFLLMLTVSGARDGRSDTLFPDAARLKARGLTRNFGLGDGSICRLVGRTKDGLDSKFHVVANACGRPILMIPTVGQGSDHTGAKTLLARLPAGAKRRNRKEPIPRDPDINESRNVVDNSFTRLKLRRRAATRCDLVALVGFWHWAKTRSDEFRSPGTVRRPATASVRGSIRPTGF